MSNSLKKSQSLKSRVVINDIFSQKKGFISYPIRISFIEKEVDFGVKVVYSAPKRNFKKAVERNRLKRLIRESYRKNNHSFLIDLKLKNKGLGLYIGYVGKEIESYLVIEEKIKLSLIRLLKQIEPN